MAEDHHHHVTVQKGKFMESPPARKIFRKKHCEPVYLEPDSIALTAGRMQEISWINLETVATDFTDVPISLSHHRPQMMP
jgi:hypothetical protein